MDDWMRWCVLGLLAAGGCEGNPGVVPNPCGANAHPDDRDGACFCDLGFMGDPDVECLAHGDMCGEAEARIGHSVCDHTVDEEDQWTSLSIGGGPNIAGLRRLGKYMAPATFESRLPPLFSDANYYRLHFCLMSVGFAPQFPGLTKADHARLILSGANREFYAGAIYEMQDVEPSRFAFSVETANRPEEQLSPETIYSVYRRLSDRFALGDLAYLPRGTFQDAAAAEFVDPPFEMISATGDGVTFEAYTPGIAYGRVRLHDPDAPTEYSWQDIVVFNDVPLDFEGVVAATVTGQRQDILSHLNVLSAQRGTPNFFVDQAQAVFGLSEGELMRVETGGNNYKLTAVPQEEAEAFWASARPQVDVENPAEFDHAALDAFSEIPTATPEERASSRSRFGAKTVGLATLAKLIGAEYQTPGLGVPFHYYDAFMRSNTWETGGRTLSYAETIEAWLADEAFRGDPTVRAERLQALRDEMESNGVVDAELVQMLHDAIAAEFGSDTVMVRIRSSSNAEDTPSFNGAGLYDSTSACAADSYAPVGADVSLCDANKKRRTLERGLARVWASLWNFGAFEERDFYQMDHRAIAMGATVSMRFEAELANGVAFTGNPVDSTQDRYAINVQAGETSVVEVMPGVTAELSFLSIDGVQVTAIERAVTSSLVPEGQTVMSDARLTELGELMAQIADVYPVDYTAEDGLEPLLDMEFKITSEDRLVIKQIRTFLPSPYAADPTCRD